MERDLIDLGSKDLNNQNDDEIKEKVITGNIYTETI